MVDRNKALKEYIEEKHNVRIKIVDLEQTYYMILEPYTTGPGTLKYKLKVNCVFTRLCDILDYLEGKTVAYSFESIFSKSAPKKDESEFALLYDVCSYWDDILKDTQRREDYLARTYELLGFSKE